MKDPFAKREVKIAVIGGGTGSFTMLSALYFGSAVEEHHHEEAHH